MGAMVRYKVPAMPFMAVFFIMIMNKEKMMKWGIKFIELIGLIE